MPGEEAPREEAEEVASPTTELLSTDQVVAEAMIAQAIEGTLTALEVDPDAVAVADDTPHADAVPDRPDVTRIPESEPAIGRTAER